jgi:hypothetical protein
MSYYYDCAIEAAYMAKNFGFLFYKKDVPTFAGGITWVNNYPAAPYKNSTEALEGELHLKKENNKYCVHPDSVKLLEPQEGDIGINEIGATGTYQKYYENLGDNKSFPRIIVPAGFCSCRRIPIGACKIIQRNNKPFIMPKVEI